MARPLRVEYPGALYHVTARGVAQQDIFFGDDDREFFLERLGEAHDRYGFVFHGYCLMTNHYHLEVETPEAGLSRGMQWLNQTYASHVNRGYGRAGHLFQGRFRSALVESESYLHALTRYVHLNPVRANLVDRPLRYKWSSYGAYLGRRECPRWLEVRETLERFGRRLSEQRRKYRSFVEEEVAANPLEDMVFGAVLGTERFVEWIRERLLDAPADREVAWLEQARARPSLREICMEVSRAYRVSPARIREKGRKHHEARDVALYLSREHSGLALREIGEHFGGITAAGVSVAHKKIVRRLCADRSLRTRVLQLSGNWSRG